MTWWACGVWGVLTGWAIAASPPHHIVGGQDAADTAWPEAVAFVRDGDVVCTGTLVTSDVVLTAGHCLPALAPAEVRAVVGEVAWAAAPGIALAGSGAHPLEEGGLDVAWVRLAAPVEVVPRALPRVCEADQLVDGADVVLVGFGTVDGTGQVPSTRLQEAASTVQDARCADPTQGCRPWDVSPVELVAGGEGVDACVGDSGGPLYLPTASGAVLVGVASRSALGSARSCGDGGIYTRVDAVQDWLAAEVGTAAAGEPCAPEEGEEDQVGEGCACEQAGAPMGVWWMLVALGWRRRR